MLTELLPFETLTALNQQDYYNALYESGKEGKSTTFIGKKLSTSTRIGIFLNQGHSDFTRKDYMAYFKKLSTATASRDIKYPVLPKHDRKKRR